MPSIVRVAYFSPTHTTKTVAEEVAGALAAPLGASVEIVELTLPGHRPADVSCGADDVIVGLYGNRDFDDALLEAADLLGERGFDVVAAGAFIGEHSLTARVGSGRPDDADVAAAQRFGRELGERLARGSRLPQPAIKGNRPYKELKPGADVRPITTDACTSCGICAARVASTAAPA